MDFLKSNRLKIVGRWFVAAGEYVVSNLPGYPAFIMSSSSQRREAFARFVIAVIFSLSPLILIVFLDALSSPEFHLFASLGKYTSAGQVYFYVGAILGGAFILIRDNFREDHRSANSSKLTGGELAMRTERTWFMGYMYFISIISVVILCVYHLRAAKSPALIYWSSGSIYVVSLYVWYVDILYSQINLSDSTARNEQGEGVGRGGERPENPDLAAIEESLQGFDQGESK